MVWYVVKLWIIEETGSSDDEQKRAAAAGHLFNILPLLLGAGPISYSYGPIQVGCLA